MACATFYYHVKRLCTADKYADIRRQIVSIFHAHKGRYGSRRILLELRNRGITVNHKTVEKLMHECGIKCRVRAVRYRSYKGEVGKIAPNVLQRDFKAVRPNQKWATDVTQISIGGEKRYLSPVMDLFNGEIIAYTVSEHPDLKQVTDMLEQAFKKVKDTEGLILHSDQGSHYQHARYQYILKQHKVIQSMSYKGNCLDNAVMENFFGIMKSELLYLHKFESMELFAQELHKYIRYYNVERIKGKLKGMSPVKYRTHYLQTILLTV